MGVVYRARDRYLDRPVALKVLSHEGAGRDHVLARFAREAKILASINSPNIAAIHGYETAGDTHVLVLELVEGLTLRERLEQGRMPLNQVIAVCEDVAAALRSAHDLGIIHCDLKPENIKITPEGVVKILDFGIATRMDAASGRVSWPPMPAAGLEFPVEGTSLQAEATEERSVTDLGEVTTSVETLVGTPPYMSPEQVLREHLSNRTDTWAFGCLLFECLAGKSPFAKRTLPETFMAIVGTEPDWAVLPGTTPPRLRTLLQRCLEKDPTRRLADMSEARHELQLAALETNPDRSTAAKLSTHNLPAGRGSFIGRAQEAKHVAAVLARTRLVTLVGPGGSGKTRLATEVGFHLLESFADGVWLVELTADVDPPSLPRVIAAALGLAADGTADLAQALQLKEMLLILDAGEQALSACADLAGQLLSDCPSLHILAVGQERLDLVGEAAYTVLPLEWPIASTGATLADVGGIDSVALFVDRATSSVPTFRLTEETAPTIAEICRLLFGLPLGIELAAAQVRAHSLDALAKLLSQEIEAPARTRLKISEYQTAVRAVVEWAMRQLSDSEASVLRRLAVFAGGWTMEAARAVCGGDEVEDVFAVLARLTDLSFIYVENRSGQTRYRMSNAIRERTCELLRESNDCTIAKRRHCEFFIALTERADPLLDDPERAVWHGRLEADAANIRTAFAFAEDCEGDDLWAAFDSMEEETLFRRLSIFRGSWTVAAAEAICGGNGVEGVPSLLRRLVERSLVLARGREDEQRYEMPVLVGRRAREMLHAAGEAATTGRRYRAFFLKLAEDGRDGLAGPQQAMWLRLLEADYANLRDAVRSYEDPAEADASLRFAAALSRFWDVGGHLEEGRQLIERALAQFGTTAAPVVTAHALVGAARLAVRAGEPVAAQSKLERADRLFRKAGDRAGIAEVLTAQANAALRRGDYAGARSMGEESLELCRDLGDRRGAAWSLLTLGEAAYRDGAYAASLGFREEALTLFREVGDRRGLAWALASVGRSAFRQGDLDSARTHFAESLATHRELGDRPGIAWSLSSLAHVALARGDFSEARALLEEGLVLSKHAGNIHGVAWSLVHLANVAYHEGEFRTSASVLLEGLSLFRERKVDGGSAWCLYGMGNVARRRGKLRSAHTLLAESLVAFTKLGEKRGVASALRGCSLLAAAVGVPDKAAQLLGAARALQDEMGETLIPPEQREVDKLVDELRQELGEAPFASALEQGRAQSPGETVRLAVSRPDGSPHRQLEQVLSA
jgi:serine/threonine protein kinase/predicted ATPase